MNTFPMTLEDFRNLDNIAIRNMPRATGAVIRIRMRRAGVTISRLAQYMGLSEDRVREVKEYGTMSGQNTWEWLLSIEECKTCRQIPITDILANRHQYSFCTIPKGVKYALVNYRNHVVSYQRKANPAA